MLSTVGRAAIKRVGGGVSTSTNRTLQSLWGLQRVQTSKCGDGPSQTLSWARLTRFFATASETAVKTKAPRKKGTTTTKKATTKAKKTTTKAKAAPKKKKAVKKKTVVKKKPVKRPKKVLTPEEKLKLDIKELKLKALLKEEPSTGHSSAWNIVVTDVTKGAKGGLRELTAEAKERYRSASPAELEDYNHRATEHKVAATDAHKKWVEAHPVQVIVDANNARKQLRRKLNAKGSYPLIRDDRIPKRPTTAWALFNKERHASGDLRNVGSLAEKTKLVLDEWNSLSASEKQPFLDQEEADRRRYQQEFKTVFGRESKPKPKPA